MRNRALLSAVALCFISAGCDSQKAAAPPAPKAAAAVTPLPPPAPAAPAASANQDAPKQLVQADTKPAEAKATAALGPPKGCGQTHKCKVDIKVGAKCAVTVDFPSLPVFKGAGAVEIQWSISTPGWKFTDNGIEFKTKSPNAPVTSPAGGNSNNYRWTDAAATAGTFRYSIHVVNGKDTCDHDPSIVNGAEMEGPPPY